MNDRRVEDLLRANAPRALGALVRRYGAFDECEDAVQEALLAASRRWPTEGVPDNPSGWLISVASRRLIDMWRGDEARRRREALVASREPPRRPAGDEPGADPVGDDSLTLLLLCCHPALSEASQVALTLRAVGGLSTAEIASAFLVPESTMGQRISRAKRTIRTAGGHFTLPGRAEWEDRLRAVLGVLYLIFNEGYTTTSGPALHRTDLTAEAIRLARELHRALPEDGEVAGLLALMLLTDARRPARTDGAGRLVPLAEQDRGRWDRTAIAEGTALVTASLARAPLGPYQLQAAIAAVHDEAASAEETDWPQILALYDLLDTIAPGPMQTLNRAVAVAHVRGAAAALALLAALDADDRVSGHHRLHAVRAHIQERAGDVAGALASYRRAARLTTSLPERQYLETRADACKGTNVSARSER